MYWSKWVLSSFVLRILAQSKQGATYQQAGVWAPTDGPHLFGILVCICFLSIPPAQAQRPVSHTVLPSPFPVVAFQCKGLDEWLQLAHQKASPAKGPWWLRFYEAKPPLSTPPPTHCVRTELAPVSAYSILDTKILTHGGLNWNDIAKCLWAQPESG